MTDKLEQRMYVLTNMYFSGIHAGIQSAHAIAKYVFAYQDRPETAQWVTTDQTIICLDGGFSSNYHHFSMDEAASQLTIRNHPFSMFQETMANNCLTAIAFLVDERVWDKEKYPDPTSPTIHEEIARSQYAADPKKYLEDMMVYLYGEEVAWMRKFLKGRSLAR